MDRATLKRLNTCREQIETIEAIQEGLNARFPEGCGKDVELAVLVPEADEHKDGGSWIGNEAVLMNADNVRVLLSGLRASLVDELRAAGVTP